MNIYLISQDVNDGLDTYDSAIVVAKNITDAATIHPSEFVTHIKDNKWMGMFDEAAHKNPDNEYENDEVMSWLKVSEIHKVKVELIGKADKSQGRGVIISSYNTG